jgi:ATP-dependent Lon protease
MAAKESVKVRFDSFRANATRGSACIKPGEHDYHFHMVELHNSGPTTAMTLATFTDLCSAVLGKPIQFQMVILGNMSLGGNLVPVENLAQATRFAKDAGGNRILLQMASVGDIPTIPSEIFAKFQTSFYANPVDSVFKAMGVHQAPLKDQLQDPTSNSQIWRLVKIHLFLSNVSR